MSRILVCASVLVLGAAVPASAQEAEPSAFVQTVTPEKAKLGEPFVRKLVVTHPKDQRYELRLPGELGEFEVLDQTRRREDGPDSATTTFELRMSAFELGARTLPPFEFDVTSAQGVARFTAPEAPVEIVATLPPDADEKGTQLHDIRPPEAVAVPSYAVLWAALAALAVAALAYLLLRWWRNRPKTTAPTAPVLPLDVRTRNALAALAAEDLPGKGEVKAFYSRLSEIVRGYVGDRFGVEALECTTTELLDSLRDLNAPELPREGLASFLQEADLVKFAKAQMSAESCHHAMAFAHQLLDVTTPRPAATGTDAPDRQLS
ncbi:MAG: DUF4381 family protein [Myxococcaceae bacterium]